MGICGLRFAGTACRAGQRLATLRRAGRLRLGALPPGKRLRQGGGEAAVHQGADMLRRGAPFDRQRDGGDAGGYREEAEDQKLQQAEHAATLGGFASAVEFPALCRLWSFASHGRIVLPARTAIEVFACRALWSRVVGMESLPPEPRDRMARGAVFALLALGALITLYALLRPSAPGPGTPVPDVRLELLDGGETRLGDLAGQVVLLDFWATWCPPCVESMPSVRNVASSLADRGVVALAVNQDNPGPQREAMVRHFLKKQGLEGLMVALDDGGVASTFDVTGLPTLVVIGRDGKIAATHLGAVDEEELRALLAPAISGVR